jgi:hypothetical protein
MVQRKSKRAIQGRVIGFTSSETVDPSCQEEFDKHGCTEIETGSRYDFDAARYTVAHLEAGDVLVVRGLGALGSSTRNIMERLDDLLERGAHVIVTSDGVDSRNPQAHAALRACIETERGAAHAACFGVREGKQRWPRI